MQPDPATVAGSGDQPVWRGQAVPVQADAQLDAVGAAGAGGVDLDKSLAAGFEQDPAQIDALTQAPPLRLDSTAASMNFTPRTPSSTVGVSIAAGSASRPSMAAQICSAASL